MYDKPIERFENNKTISAETRLDRVAQMTMDCANTAISCRVSAQYCKASVLVHYHVLQGSTKNLKRSISGTNSNTLQRERFSYINLLSLS